MNFDPFADAGALLSAMQAGSLSPTGLLEAELARVTALEPRIHAFNDLDIAGARAAALESAARYAAGSPRPLEGLPLGIKANIAVAGLPFHGGFGFWRARRAAADAEVVARLRAAGAVILGTLNLHEGALGAVTDNPHFGATENPHKPGFTAGGSSGGSGAAVAAGLCAAALGTDTLGSVRIPAAYCGIYGLKPTNGLVPDTGLLFLVEAWDCIGPMARSVADLGRLLAVMAPDGGGDLPPATRIGLLDGGGKAELAPAVASALRLSADLLKGLGLEVRPFAPAFDPHRLRLAGFVTAAREAKARFGADMARDLAEGGTGFSPAFRASIDFADRFAPAALAEGEAALLAARDTVRGLFGAVDVLLMPTAPQPAFPLASPAPSTQADFTALANIAGLPALSLPAGWAAGSLPVAVQLVGRPGAEMQLIALAERLDSALNAYRPPLLES
jgi:aspartyl-tRNA(Asn)/glutamyl-tRNA(Gln) amidotransferase subunit A